MKIYYYTITGNIPRFLTKCGLKGELLTELATVSAPFVLVTNTIGFGQVPEPVDSFLKRNHKKLIAVAASGNRNWGNNFARAADLIAKQYSVPILHKFELSGTEQDVKTFTEGMMRIVKTYRTQ